MIAILLYYHVQYFINLSVLHIKFTGYMFRFAKEPLSGQLQSLNQLHAIV
jgi:hypothetical protein